MIGLAPGDRMTLEKPMCGQNDARRERFSRACCVNSLWIRVFSCRTIFEASSMELRCSTLMTSWVRVTPLAKATRVGAGQLRLGVAQPDRPVHFAV